jgi:peptidoglycan/LPS O-acetylase OafA/YrhL
MNQPKLDTKPIFNNLDGIRFIAFLGVFISHVFFPRSQSVKSGEWYKAISFFVGNSHWGDLGLYIFFTMSGFLITYLLIQENQAYGKIHVFSFYMRRVLRIWPLYFMLLLTAFFIYPFFSGYHIPLGTRWAYLFFYANFDVIQNGFNPGAIGHLWAISVEEQFYLVLPLVMLVVRMKYLPYVFVAILAGSQVFRAAHATEPSVLFHHSFSAAFDISLGGLAAWLMFYSDKAKQVIKTLPRRYILAIYFIMFGMVLFQDFLFTSSTFFVSLLLFQLFGAFVLLEQNFSDHSFFKTGKSKLLTSLGKYAYGFFCYHIFSLLSD